MANLSTTYLGLPLKSPLVVSSNPLTESIDNLRQMEEAGAAAVVLYSLFEEEIELQNAGYDPQRPGAAADLPAALKHVAEYKGYRREINGYLAHIYQAKRVVGIPIIGSLNGYYSSGWIKYARLIEAAGADALELNVYYLPTNPKATSSDVEKMYLDLVKRVKATVQIPVAVKLSPYFSALANMAQQLDKIGANGLVFFNRFYQPDIDLETREVTPSLVLSTPDELRLRLRWVAVLHEYLKADFAVTGGVHRAEDVLKSVMVGAKVAMMASALLKHGIPHLQTVLSGVNQWLDDHEYASIEQLRGEITPAKGVGDVSAFARANYMRVLASYREEEK